MKNLGYRQTTWALSALLVLCSLQAGPADARTGSAFDFGHHRLHGSGDLESRNYDLDGFDRIRLDSGMDLDIRFGDDFSVQATLDDNLIENLVLDVSDGTLLIDWKEDCDPDDDSLIRIVLPKLESMQINGAGDIDIRGFKGRSFSFDLSGACDLDIDGEVETLEIDLHGAGDINARKLKAEAVEVSVSGAGDVDVTATRSIEARISGVGRISYWGEPEQEKTRVSGIGHISRK